MTIEEIFEEISEYYQKHGVPPKCTTRDVKHLVREASRKIGSWRKVLWLAGVLHDERKTDYAVEHIPTVKSRIRIIKSEKKTTLRVVRDKAA